MDEARTTTRKVMKLFEETTNEAKEENVTFGERDAANIRFLGVWLGEEEDTRTRIKRRMGAWWKVKRRLNYSRFTKRTQARVMEAAVESTTLYNCNVRTWYTWEINRLQHSLDKCYRYVWRSKTMASHRELEARGCNMRCIQKKLRVKSVRMKIELRSLERLGHVLRMPRENRTRKTIFGWLKKLETQRKEKKRYRGTGCA